MRKALQAVVLLIGMAAGLMAQENTGSIYGHVTEEKGPIPGATATLSGALAPQTTVSDANGYFRILRVPPGRYKLTVTMPGFNTVTFENVIVTLGKDTELDVPLSVSRVSEAVTVTSTTPLIDTRQVETGATFTREELTQIPTSRDIYSLMQQVPGIQLDTVNVGGNASGSIGGPDFTTKGTGNVTYQVDGATVTDNSYGAFQVGQARQNGGSNLYFDFDTFDQVQVSTGGSLLELQTPGTTINIVTKRGTNDLKGSTRFLYASDRWQASNLPAEAVQQGFQTNSTRFIREYGAEIGGPIVKDRLFFWGAASRQDISLNEGFADTAGNQVQSTARLEPVTFKINGNIASSNAMSLYFQRSDRFQTRVGLSDTRSVESTSDLNIPTNFYKLDDNLVFSPDLFGSAFISYQDARYLRKPLGGPNAEVVYDANGVYQNGYLAYNTKNPQYQANVSASKFFNTGKINHELKFSFNYRRQVNDSSSSWPGDQIVASEYSSEAQITRGVRSIYKTEYYAGTLGDTLTTGNLTVNAGVRYDYQRGRNLPSSAAANPVFPDLLPAVQFNGNNGYPFQYKNLEPRVSATYALGQNKTTLIRGSYARYADQLGFITYQMNGLPVVSGYYYDWTDLNGDHRVQRNEVDLVNGFEGIYNVDPATAPNPANALASNFKTPTTDELTIGADHQLFNDFAVSATYTYRHVKDLQYRLPIGADATTWSLGGVAQGTAVAQNGFMLPYSVPFYFLTLNSIPTGDLFLNRPGAVQNYSGIEFSAVKRLSNHWMLRASGGWNDWTQNIPSEAILDPNNRWDLGGQDTNHGQVVGYSGKDTVWVNARWQFNITGLYQFPLGINLGANFFGREGYPQSYYIRAAAASRDIDGTRYRNLIDNIDSFRLDNVYELDLRLEKTFNLGPVALSATAELFNVTNNNTVLQRESQAGTYNASTNHVTPFSSFNQILETQSPRILRLGGRVSF